MRVETAERCERAGAEEIAESKRDIAAACAETRVSRVWQSKWTQMPKKAGRPDPKKIRNLCPQNQEKLAKSTGNT